MIQNIEILYSTTQLLRKNFSDSLIIIDDNNEDIKKYDTFHVEVKELLATPYLRYVEKIVNVYITYIPLKKDETTEQILKVQHLLNDIFDNTLVTLNRKLIIDNKTFNYDEKFLTMNLSFKFFDNKSLNNIPEMDKYSQLMKELNLTLKERND